MRFSRNFFATIIFSVFFIFSVFSTTAKTTKIRVGFFQFDGYHQINEDGAKSGYGYDFLQMIAPYADFEYEYIGYEKSWAEVQQMLVDDEIDLLTSAQKNPPREEIFDYSERSIGYSSTVLTTLPSNAHFITSDYSKLGIIKVGMMTGNSRNESFKKYAQKYSLNYIPVYFDDQIKMALAMEQGIIDAMVSSDLRRLKHEIIVAKFDDSPFYAIVRKGNTELLNKLNYAIARLSSDSPNWMHNLFYKYYSNSYRGNELVFSSEEKEYLKYFIKENGPLRILFNPDRAPYSYIEDGVFKGIFIDLFNKFADKLDINYEFIKTTSVKDYQECIARNEPNIIFGTVLDYDTAENMDYSITNAFHVTSIAKVTRSSEPTKKHKVAVIDGMSVLNKRYEGLYSNDEQIKCESVKECIDMIKEGGADCCYLYVYTAAKYVYEDLKGELMYTPIDDTFNSVSIAVRAADGADLFHIMNKVVGNLSEDDVQFAVADNTNFFHDDNFLLYLIYKRPVFSLGIIVFIVLLTFLVVIMKNKKQQRISSLLLQETKAKNDALELACEAADKANKAKSDFLSKMSHDIRTPMNAIVGLTSIAQTHTDKPDRVSEYLSKINSSSQHLLRLINDILDMSKIESGSFTLSHETFNVENLINELVTIESSEIKARKHNLKVTFEDIVHKNVIGDPLRIQQVFINLLNNAIKYTPNGGKITINVKELDCPSTNIARYRFIFKDNGIGMSKEFVKVLFEPFSRENDSRVDKIQGTGLGLAITKNIVTMMDGTIDVESEQDKGTQFTVILKLKYEDQDEKASVNSLDDSNGEANNITIADFKKFNFTGKTVLLVDDNQINREIAREILEMTGIEVEEAENGKDALEKFVASQDGKYHLIFMDMQMPVMNGCDASNEIRNLQRNDAKSVPIVAMTANAFNEDIEKAIQSGMNDHIAKPLDVKKLAYVLHEYFA